jgi:hypothetical protein
MTAGINDPAVVGVDGLASRLRGMAQGRDAIDVAQFQFIGLEDIRQAYGDRWGDQKARIQESAETFLRRRVHESDLLIRGDGGFLVVFGSAMAADSESLAHQLAHGLNDFFLGEEPQDPMPRFGVTTASMPVKDLAAHLEGAGLVEAKAQPDPVNRAAPGLRDIDWRFLPVWDAKREILSNWYVAPYLKTSGARLPGYMFEPAAAHPSQFAAVDEAGLWVAEQALHRLVVQGKQALVGVSVHVSSLTNLSTRTKLMSAIDRLDRGLARYRVVKVAGIPPGFPRMYLNEIVGLLRSRIPNVVLGTAFNEPDVASLAASGPSAISVAVPPWTVGPNAAIPAAQLHMRLAEALVTTHAAHIRVIIEGAIDGNLAAKLKGAGVDNLCSTQIWPSVTEPDGMLKWPTDKLAA